MTDKQMKGLELNEKRRSNLKNEDLAEKELKRKKTKDSHDRFMDYAKMGGDIAKIAMGINSPKWYMLDPNLAKDAAQISFNTPLGYNVKSFADGFENKPNSTVPGIMVIRFVPSLGNEKTIDIAAKNIYAFVRHANSGSRNYEASDLMMYILAMDQAYSYHAYLRKIYSLLMTSKSENRYYLDAMLYAHGVNYNDLRNHISDLRIFINNYAVRLNSYYCPKDLPLFERHYWMNSTIFKDQPVKKSQEYVFLQDDFGVYNDTDGKIEFDNGYFYPGANRTFQSLVSKGNSIISALTDNDDAGIMSGDILKAYGENNMLFLPRTEEDYHIESSYSEEVLNQITNATLAGRIISSYDISQHTTLASKKFGFIYQGEYLTQMTAAQDPDYLAQHPEVLNTNVYGILVDCGIESISTNNLGVLGVDQRNSVINFHKDNPSAEEIIVATRLMSQVKRIPSTDLNPAVGYRANATVESSSSTRWGFVLETFGSEIATTADIIGLDSDMNPIIVNGYSTYIPGAQTGSGTTVQRWIPSDMISIAQFDWAPATYPVGIDGTVDSNNNKKLVSLMSKAGFSGFCDMANYATVPTSTLQNLHYVSILSELGIPLLGTKVRSR